MRAYIYTLINIVIDLSIYLCIFLDCEIDITFWPLYYRATDLSEIHIPTKNKWAYVLSKSWKNVLVMKKNYLDSMHSMQN